MVTAPIAFPGTIEQAAVLAEPQMQVRAGAIQGCGYRLKGIPSSPDLRRPILLLDASFNIYSEGFGLLKAGALQVDGQRVDAAKTVVRPIVSFWLKVEGEKPIAAKGGKFIPAETVGYLLAGADVQVVVQLFEAVWDRRPIMVGVRIKGEGVDRIYSGVPQTTEHEKNEGLQCFTGLAKQMQTDAQREKN